MVTIDIGHGGKDPGASANGVVEKDAALEIGLVAGKELEAHGVDVTYTRITDTYLTLSERARIANNANSDIMVSIHLNAGGGDGIEAYSYPGSKNGLKLSNDLLNAMMAANIFDTNRGAKTANFAVLRLTRMPSCLIECGFVDNKANAAIIKQNINEIGLAIADGILTHLGVDRAVTWQDKAKAFATSSGISDGTRPTDYATRQEIWAMLERFTRI